MVAQSVKDLFSLLVQDPLPLTLLGCQWLDMRLSSAVETLRWAERRVELLRLMVEVLLVVAVGHLHLRLRLSNDSARIILMSQRCALSTESTRC